MAREAGYESVATSRLGANAADANRFALRRYAMRRGDRDDRFEACCTGAGLWMARARERLLAGAKSLLGTRIYSGLRGRALGASADSPGAALKGRT
jgi:hypothetical protein